MKIVHQISFNDTEDGPRCRFLREQRIAVAFTSLPAPPTCTDPTGLVTVSVEEADPAWPLLRDRIEDWRVVDSVTTLFTDEDRAGARYFSLEPEWQHGYPMPDSDHDWLYATYDCTARCRTCGAGAVQKAPFRLTGEPRWGRRGVLQMHWVSDEFFVTPAVYSEVFRPLGIEAREVIENRSGMALKTALQLRFDSIAPFPLQMDRSTGTRCPACGGVRFDPHRRGWFPAPAGSIDAPSAKTMELFGSGCASWRAILVNRVIYEACVAAGVRGVSFWPVAEC